MNKTKNKIGIRYITYAGITAALYVALTAVSAAFGLSSGPVQVRISEALCVLPVFFRAAVPGVTVGCLISNLIFGGTVFDIIFGTLATLIGALFAYTLRKHPYFSPIPTILSNAAIVPAVIVMSTQRQWDLFPYYALTVGAGEIISCGGIGCMVIFFVNKSTRLKKLISD